MTHEIDLSVVMSTYNRGGMLGAAVASVLDQRAPGVSRELIVVDNNSTDDTRQVVERIMVEQAARGDAGESGGDGGRHGAPRLRYVFEGRQGLSHARNTGIREARGAIIAFTDDDVRAAPDWAAQIVRAFGEHPEVEYVGGKVLPLWEREPPAWLTRDHWSPLALVDYGDEGFHVDESRAICLVGANMAFRRRVFDEFGRFAADFQRVKNSIGSTEDDEFQSRLRRAGKQGFYVPEAVIAAEVQAERQTKQYHRRWHAGHGRFNALMRIEEFERSSAGRLFDLPAHLYRQALIDGAKWLRAHLRGRSGEAFSHETRLKFFAGFFTQRSRDYLASGERGGMGRLYRALLGKSG